jgi:hypothetical protein
MASEATKKSTDGPYQRMLRTIDEMLLHIFHSQNFEVTGWALAFFKGRLGIGTLGGPRTGLPFSDEEKDILRKVFEMGINSDGVTSEITI